MSYTKIMIQFFLDNQASIVNNGIFVKTSKKDVPVGWFFQKDYRFFALLFIFTYLIIEENQIFDN